MKNKIIKLISEGFSMKTLVNMSEKQIDTLYKRINENKKEASEAQTKTTTTTTFSISDPTDRKNLEDMMGKKGIPTQINPATDKVTITSGKEKELGEGNKKKKGKNPWAICTSTMGKEFGTTERSEWSKSEMKKYEKCVLDVKKSIKEGKDPYETILENRVLEILKQSVSPKMTKRDFLNTLYTKSISEAEEAPVKAPPKPKTPTKPGKPGTPYQPKIKPKPKAEDSDIPTWFKWENLGIKLKK
jgi:hypothetical protein